jgi:FixJ family two-component response regulator
VPKATRLISIVDDDYSVRRALSRLVQFAGFSAETFGSAEDFLRSAALGSTACLVLDIHLSGRMDGFDLQERLTADQVTIPIIFITAHDDTATRARAERSGAAAYLLKPFEGQILLDAIEATVG